MRVKKIQMLVILVQEIALELPELFQKSQGKIL